RPPSDLPVLRYKVFWSRRLHGEGEGDAVTPTAASDAPTAPADGPGPSTTTTATTAAKQTSVLVHHQTVGGDVLQFMLKSLEPNSLYFLQVQAIAQYGRERLKSGKGAIFLNTGAHPINGSIS
ncbi:SFRICE_034090, partial [Gryllus bimaculatus]